MEPLTIFLTAFVVGFSGAVMPGPVTAVMVKHVVHRGFLASPLVTLGHAVMEFAMLLLLVGGVGRFLSNQTFAGVIGIAGAFVLAWMGHGMFRAQNVSLKVEASANSNAGPILGGMLTTVANPYWFLWWATVGASYVALSRDAGARGILAFFSGHILADFIWLAFLSLVLISGRRFITDHIYRIILKILALFLFFMAIYFFWSGIMFIK